MGITTTQSSCNLSHVLFPGTKQRAQTQAGDQVGTMSGLSSEQLAYRVRLPAKDVVCVLRRWTWSIVIRDRKPCGDYRIHSMEPDGLAAAQPYLRTWHHARHQDPWQSLGRPCLEGVGKALRQVLQIESLPGLRMRTSCDFRPSPFCGLY